MYRDPLTGPFEVLSSAVRIDTRHLLGCVCSLSHSRMCLSPTQNSVRPIVVAGLTERHIVSRVSYATYRNSIRN